MGKASREARERAEKEGIVFRDGKLVKKEKCAYPPCQHHAHPQSKLGLCQTCDYVIHLIGWFDQKMAESEQKPRGPVLVVPRPGMGDAAIKEAIAKRGKP